MAYHMTQHAADVASRRGIQADWITRTLDGPGKIEPDRRDPTLVHHVPSRRDGILRRFRQGSSLKLKVDQAADALCLTIDDSPVAESQEVAPGVILDFNARGEVVGVEILGLSKREEKLNLKELLFSAA